MNQDPWILVFSDTHSGHMGGLTPPSFQLQGPQPTQTRAKFREWQKRTWDWFAEEINRRGPIRKAVGNGDLIDGTGYRSGGTELLTTDREEQVQIAKEIWDFLAPESGLLVHGTPYHTGESEDWEKVLADRLGYHIGSHEWVQHGASVLDFKHKIGPGPQAMVWERTANLTWSVDGLQPRATHIIRSHLHRFDSLTDRSGSVIITPGLQGPTKYGSRQCSGRVDFGFLEFKIEGSQLTWKPVLMDLDFSKPRIWVV